MYGCAVKGVFGGLSDSSVGLLLWEGLAHGD